MSGRQAESVGAPQGSPVKKSKLSLKFFHKKETKRALDFSEPQAEEPKTTEPQEPEGSNCEQVVYGPSSCPTSPALPVSCEKKENLVPFVGLNNLGNTCYLNSILQVLFYCPGFREGIKKLYNLSNRKDKPKEETEKSEESQQPDGGSETLPVHIELLGSFNSLIMSVEQLQSNYLLNPEGFNEGELATPPRKVLHTLRQLNSMYEGHLQHDAQEVLQCILGYIQEACDTIRKEQELECSDNENGREVKTENDSRIESKPAMDEDGQFSGKRKSDTEVGNAKKKPKSKKSDCPEENGSRNTPFTRSKRKSSSDITGDNTHNKDEEDVKMTKQNKEGENEDEGKDEKASKDTEGKRKKRAKLSWLRPSRKQPSIFSKFCSVGKISSTTVKNQNKEVEDKLPNGPNDEGVQESSPQNHTEKHPDVLSLMEKLFQGQLVLRTRCLECESFTERREDFQDISVPVLDEQPGSPEDLAEVSPDPKPEVKTLQWAITQFASVERIVGEDKYFCETCHHYTEAERSLLFDKTPEVITIHLKRFSASSLELDPYAGLSKVNTPLQTPLTLSLEEWCMKPSSAKGKQYQLFAVVMHSGVTISSGHYSAYIRISDLKDMKFWLQDKKESEVEADEKGNKEGAQKDENLSYDDGEASVGLSTRGQRRASLAKSGSKKLSEGVVGLLGGQRSLSSYELQNGSSKHTERAASRGAAEGSKRRKSINSSRQSTDGGLKKEPEAAEETSVTPSGGMETAELQALNRLLEYEGKWLLFDDSEARLFEEETFLRACSPETCSSSTPYLLFYKRMPGTGH